MDCQLLDFQTHNFGFHSMFVENMMFKELFTFADHVTVSFARSGGPGGQNVNKGLLMLFYFIVFSFLFVE